VKLYVDLETLQLIEGPGFRNPTSSLRFKRGDAAQIEVTFLAGGTTPVAIGDPLNLEIQFGIKPRNRYDIGYLVRSAIWIMPTTETPIYRCSPSFNTIELNSALGVGSATGSELAEITLMGEITWREGSAEPTSTRTFLVVVENDVNRGTEGVPTSAEPPYPAPENIVTTAAITEALANHSNAADPHPNYLRHDEQETLSAEEQANVRAAINAPEAPPYLNLPMQSINGVWHVSVLDYQPSNSSDAMTGGTPGWRGRIACYNELSWICIKDDMTQANDGWRKLWYTILGPPQVTVVLINSYESLTSFGMLEAGMNYRVRFDNFSSIPNGGIFGITYVNNGSASVSNVQLVDSAFISANISNTADFTAELTEEPTSASDIFAEFTFTADSSFNWAGYCIFGYYASGFEVSFTVTITPLP
jgi:hypothetical protein